MNRVENIGPATLYLGDCRDILPSIGQVDAIITDPPYGTTRCAWDAIIPLDEMWAAVDCCTSRNTPVILFGTEPFSSLLRTSRLGQFRYDWIWNKPKGTGFLNAKKQPLRKHETISVFAKGPATYAPQMSTGHERKKTFRGKHLQTDVYGNMAGDYHYDSTERYPGSVLTYSSDTQNSSFHPTQKPVDLMRYLIRTYCPEGGTVLDFTMGSGTTGVAAILERRRFIGVEREADYFEIACDRMRVANGDDVGPLFGAAA